MKELLSLIGKGTNSYGCGVLVTYNQVKYVATAGHVCRAMGEGPYWGIHGAALRKTQNPVGGYAIMALIDCILDTQGESDLAICQLTRDIYSDTVNLNNLQPASNLIGMKVSAIGYPVDYVSKHIALCTEDPLPPLEASGVITRKFDEPIYSNGISIPYQGGYYVKMDLPLVKNGSGFSGALVVGQDKTPLGIIVAGTESGDLIFSPIARLLPLLSKI